MFKKEWVKKLFLVVFGVAIGFVNGFLGSGGGTLAVTALLTVGGLDQKRAQATALLIILPISVVSAVVYFLNGSVDIEKTVFSTVGIVAGGALGAVLLNKLQGNVVKLIFAMILIAAGVKMFL